MKYIFQCFIVLISLQCEAKNSIGHVTTLKTLIEWNQLKGKPLSSKYGNVETVKMVFKLKDSSLYFINSIDYTFHYNFCQDMLKDNDDLYMFNEKNYSNNVKRKYIFSNINYYKNTNTYAIEFFPGDEITNVQLQTLYKKIKNNFNLSKELYVVSTAEMNGKLKPYLLGNILFLSADSIYKSQAVQTLQEGTAYGKLRKIDIKQIDKTYIKENDIVITNGLPLNIPALAGIITTVQQTPLSHLSILCNNRKTPNASVSNAWDNKYIESLVDTWVKYTVTSDTIFIVASSEAEMNIHTFNKNNIVLDLSYNATKSDLVFFNKSNYKKNIKLVGGKAANFGELTNISYTLGKKIPTPEGAFAIPFYYYVQHIKKNGALAKINDVLKTKTEDNEAIKKKLKGIRKAIMSSNIDTALVSKVKNELKKYPEFRYFRFRSSTNAEDIDGFNGAGLYESASGSLTDSNKSIEHAIKKVWASTWNEQAFKERKYFNINQTKIAMGILVHRAFGTELANGVAITKHLYRPNYPAFTINVQLGEESIVFPKEGIVAEQLLLSVDALFVGNISVDNITFSSLCQNKNILNKEQLRTLYTYLNAIKNHYYIKQSGYSTGISFENFAMDVEFKIDAYNNKLYIKQVRSFK
jgi:hypothetical protein